MATIKLGELLIKANVLQETQLKSALAIVTSAQRPSTPLQKATIALIEELAGPALGPK